MVYRLLFLHMKLGVFVLSLVLFQTGFAQTGGTKDDAPNAVSQIGVPKIDQLIEKYGKKLALTDAQKARIRTIAYDAQGQFSKQRSNSTASVKSLEQSKKTLMANAEKQIQEVLNDRQRLKLRFMKDRIRADINKRAVEVPPAK